MIKVKNFRIQLSISLLSVLLVSSCINRNPIANQFGNILNITDYPLEKSKTTGLFCDQGSWFGFCMLPDTNDIVGFGGPCVLSDKKWTSLSLAQFEVNLEKKTTPINFKKLNQAYSPGRIESSFSAEGFELSLQIVFGDNCIAYQVATLTNTSKSTVKVYPNWIGCSWQKITNDNNHQIHINLKGNRRLSLFQNQIEKGFIVDTLNNSYRLESSELIVLQPGETTTQWIAIGLSFNDNELQQNVKSIPTNLDGVLAQLDSSRQRWDGYLKSILLKQKSQYDRIAVKSVMTLISNWRKAELDLHHDGIVPSHAVTYFDGFWAWDSWKHASAVSLFAPELAKNQIRAMFDYQDTTGMIPDCIFLDKSENNLRDTKPPLAAWAVYEIFSNCHDTNFVREILPKLIAYHQWWYSYRDINKNGWCEYGSTDGTLEAAAWESGMDNAVRFDSVKMVHAGGIAWSMDQESVDLNAFLIAEKHYLSELSRIVSNEDQSRKYANEFVQLKSKFDDYFFDSKNGYYYDVSLNNGQKIRVEGTEAFIPLWAGIATMEHSEAVKNVITNSSKFNTFLPFPTLSADHPKFDVNGYWRGPVWLDQAWFGIMGLKNYHFNNEAKELTLKLFDNANGLLEDKPINENYNPLTGDRLKAPHFSWSAGHYLMLYRMGNHL